MTARPRDWSVRLRTTLASILVVGAAITIGSVLVLVVLREALADAVRHTAEARAREVAVEPLAAGELIPRITEDEEESVQVVDSSGRVLNATPGIRGTPAIADLSAGHSTQTRLPGLDGSYLVVGVRVPGHDDRTVLVARSLEDVSSSTHLVGLLLGGAAPLLLFVVAATTWFVVGRALSPVEAIRRRVQGIASDALHRRVPEPSGNDEISRLAVTMNQMLGRLEESQLRQRRFVSDASHELRSPIAAIRQVSEAAHAHPERTDVSDLADSTLSESLRAQGLVDDLLLLARADENGLSLAPRPVDLDDIALDEARHLRATTGLRIDTSRLSAGRVLGQEAYLRQLVRNLSDNAVRHAKDEVSIALAEGAELVHLVVSDDGPGVPPADRTRIFDRFVRLDDARTRVDGGTGLGLSIAAEIVRAHHGDIRVTETPGGGARFEVSLPRIADT